MEEQKYIITVDVANAVLQYLASKPYQEVEQLIVALKSGEVLESEAIQKED